MVEGAEAGGKGSFIRRGGGEGIAGNLDTGTGTRAQGEAVSGAEQVLGTTVGVGCGRLVFLRLGVGGNPGEVVMDELFDVGRPAARRVREVEGAAPVHAEAQAAVVAAWRAQVDAVGVVLAGDIEGVHERCGLWCIRKKESALNRDAGASPGGVVAGFCHYRDLPALPPMGGRAFYHVRKWRFRVFLYPSCFWQPIDDIGEIYNKG